MKKIISALMSIVIIGIMVNTQIIQAFAVDQWQLRGIQISNTGTGIQIKADVTGNKAGYKYKFVWMKGNWNPGNWGVIRDFNVVDNVLWKPPIMPADYEIYMDVRDPRGDVKTIHRSFLGLSSLKRVTRDQIKGIDKALMSMVHKMLTDKGLNMNEDERTLLDRIEKGCNLVSREQIEPLVKEFK